MAQTELKLPPIAQIRAMQRALLEAPGEWPAFIEMPREDWDAFRAEFAAEETRRRTWEALSAEFGPRRAPPSAAKQRGR